MPALERKKILVVDDDPMFLMSIKAVIGGATYDLLTARSGKEALEIIGKGMPDLIIVDAIMKEMNGFELTRAIREVDKEKKTPIIMLTGMRAESDAMHAKMAGVNLFLNKPVKGEDLLRHIRSLLGSSPFR